VSTRRSSSPAVTTSLRRGLPVASHSSRRCTPRVARSEARQPSRPRRWTRPGWMSRSPCNHTQITVHPLRSAAVLLTPKKHWSTHAASRARVKGVNGVKGNGRLTSGSRRRTRRGRGPWAHGRGLGWLWCGRACRPRPWTAGSGRVPSRCLGTCVCVSARVCVRESVCARERVCVCM
jgi:hypothetical protein